MSYGNDYGNNNNNYNRGGGYRGGSGGGRKFENRDRFERSPPVKEGEEVDVRIEAVGEKGDGVAKKDGFVLFVPNVNAGDEVRIKVTKVLRKVGFAEVLGPAQGPIAQSSSPVAPQKARSAAEEKAAELTEVAQTAESIEDSEDFGEESDTEESVEEDEQPVDAEGEVAQTPVEEDEPEFPVDEAEEDDVKPVADEVEPEEEPVADDEVNMAPVDPADDDVDDEADDDEESKDA